VDRDRDGFADLDDVAACLQTLGLPLPQADLLSAAAAGEHRLILYLSNF